MLFRSLGPAARVALSTVAGLGMLVGGTQLLGRKYHLLGQGLIGGGLATLYFAAFAAANFYHLVDLYVAFLSMALIFISFSAPEAPLPFWIFSLSLNRAS